MDIYLIDDPVRYIREHRDMYIGPSTRSLRDELLVQLVSDALALGCPDLKISKHGSWSPVGSNVDWLRSGVPASVPVRELFARVFPLTELGANSIRHEVVVRALAQSVFAFGPETFTTLEAWKLRMS